MAFLQEKKREIRKTVRSQASCTRRCRTSQGKEIFRCFGRGFSEGPAIESIRIRNEKELGDAETLQDKISKGFRDIFGSKKKDEEEESLQEEDTEEEIHEEMIKKTISKEEFAEIPQLEKEGAVPTKAAELKCRN